MDAGERYKSGLTAGPLQILPRHWLYQRSCFRCQALGLRLHLRTILTSRTAEIALALAQQRARPNKPQALLPIGNPMRDEHQRQSFLPRQSWRFRTAEDDQLLPL